MTPALIASPGRVHRSVVVVVALFAVAVAAAWWMQREVGRLRGEARELTARNGALLARLRQERELIAALGQRRPPAARPARGAGGDSRATDAPTDAAADPAVAAEASAWVTRWQALHAQLSQHPEAAIPELALLGEVEWLQVARSAEFDTPEHTRQSLAALRSAAKQKFAEQLSLALRRYLAVTAGRLPLSIDALASYFDPPMDAAILQRYETVRTTDGRAPAAGVSFIRERAVVDEEFDSRYGVDAGGAIAATPPVGSM